MIYIQPKSVIPNEQVIQAIKTGLLDLMELDQNDPRFIRQKAYVEGVAEATGDGELQKGGPCRQIRPCDADSLIGFAPN